MDCGKRVEQMWSPSGEGTRMDDFRERVNKELQLTLSESPSVHACMQTGWTGLGLLHADVMCQAEVHTCPQLLSHRHACSRVWGGDIKPPSKGALNKDTGWFSHVPLHFMHHFPAHVAGAVLQHVSTDQYCNRGVT